MYYVLLTYHLLTLNALPHQWITLDTAIVQSLWSKMLTSVTPSMACYLLCRNDDVHATNICYLSAIVFPRDFSKIIVQNRLLFLAMLCRLAQLGFIFYQTTCHKKYIFRSIVCILSYTGLDFIYIDLRYILQTALSRTT